MDDQDRRGPQDRRSSPGFQVEADARRVEFARLDLAGYLGRDAQVVHTPQREFVALSVGTTASWRDADQQRHERTLWVKVLAFGEWVEPLKDLKRGAPVYVTGPLSYDRWESRQGPRHAPVVRVTDRSGEVQVAPMPGGQFARVTVSGVLGRDAVLGRGEDERASARLWVQARTGHSVLVRGPLVEHLVERLKAGHGVHLDGRLELHRWQDDAGKAHERVTVVVGGPDTQIRVDRTPLALPGPEPKPVAPAVALDPPAPVRGHERTDRSRR